MNISKPISLNLDDRLAIISAIAEAQGLSDCDITDSDIEEFCQATGWGRAEYDYVR